jgi:hypothetical protein
MMNKDNILKRKNMKKLLYIFAIAILGFSVSSCHDLDLEPKGIFTEDVLLSTDHGVKFYLSSVYNFLPIEDFNFYVNQGYARQGNRWEAFKNFTGHGGAESTGWSWNLNSGFHYWSETEHGNDGRQGYPVIRRINNLIEQIPNYSAYHSAAQINSIIAEARFLRAWYYFVMVRQYGGVPLIDKVQVTDIADLESEWESLLVERATEYNTWKFIYNDLKFAMDNMPATSEIGRGNRYVAAALMTRTMLYAASIANYFDYYPIGGGNGAASLAGLQGMRKSQAAEFYQYVIDAANFIEKGPYALHRGADKEQAFVEVFLDNTIEDIFVKQFGPHTTTPGNAALYNNWDMTVLPIGESLSPNVGMGIHPAWDLLRLYQMPALSELNASGDEVPVRFNRIEDLWDNDEMEARARATFFYSGMTYPGETISGNPIVFDFLAGVFTRFPGTVADATTNEWNTDYTRAYRVMSNVNNRRPNFRNDIPGFVGQNIKISGAHGVNDGGGIEGYSITGVGIRKYVNYRVPVGQQRGFNQGSQNWKALRYAEVLLNRAEALYELGLINNDNNLKQAAFVDINEIRNRAGARPYNMVAAPANVADQVNAIYLLDENLQFIRDERARELAFEHHRWFDFKRWRIAHTKLENFRTRGLLAYRVLDEDKYIFLPSLSADGRHTLNFNRRDYYRQLPDSQTGINPNLIRNDEM